MLTSIARGITDMISEVNKTSSLSAVKDTSIEICNGIFLAGLPFAN